MKLVIVYWEDITNSSRWEDYEVVENWDTTFLLDPSCQSVGWLVKETNDAVILAAQKGTNEDKILGMVTRIPKGVIQNIVPLENPEDAN